MPERLNIQKIFSAPDVKHGLFLFNSDEINGKIFYKMSN
jgi:hypothetical protein